MDLAASRSCSIFCVCEFTIFFDRSTGGDAGARPSGERRAGGFIRGDESANIDVSPLLKLGDDGDFDGEDGESDCQVGSGSGSGTPDLGVNSARSGDF